MPDRPLLDRAQLARIAQNVPQTIAGLEKIVGSVAGFPSTIEEANALAAQALTVAQAALASLAAMAETLERLETAPLPPPHTEADDHAPRTHLGTISSQNADQVEITGGAIDNTPIGVTTAADAKFKKVAASDQITSTVAAGTPPLVISSPDLVPNLYVARAALADYATNAGHAASADSLTSPSTFPAVATDLSTVITLANALRAAATSKGL